MAFIEDNIIGVINKMIEQRTEEWFTARKNRVTASNVGAILGCDPFRNRADVMRAMVRAHYGAESEFKGNCATDWGTFNEDNAKADLEILLSKSIKDAGFYISKENEWLGASPDGFLNNRVLVEIKCPYSLRDKQDPTFKTIDQLPHYYAQMQIQLYCCKASTCVFYQWTPRKQDIAFVEIDHDWLKKNIPILGQFCFDFLSELDHPEKHLEDKVLKITDKYALSVAEQYKQAVCELDKSKEKVELLKKQLVEIAGDRKCLFNDLNVYKVNRAGSIPYSKIIKEKLPDVDLDSYRGNSSEYWVVK